VPWVVTDAFMSIDSNGVSGGFYVQKVTGTIASAQVLNLFSTPQSILSAPGPGLVIASISLLLVYEFGTVAYSGGGDLQLLLGPMVITLDFGSSITAASVS
jgi:hypothetical protein